MGHPSSLGTPAPLLLAWAWYQWPHSLDYCPVSVLLFPLTYWLYLLLCSHHTPSNVHVTKHFLVTSHCLGWKITLKSRAESSQRHCQKHPYKTLHEITSWAPMCTSVCDAPSDECTYPCLAGEPKLQLTLQGPARNHPALSDLPCFWQARISMSSAPKAAYRALLWVFPFTPHCPVRPPAPEECELCLSSLEPWSLARREEQVSKCFPEYV